MVQSLLTLLGNTALEESLPPQVRIQEQLLTRNLIRTGVSLLTWLLVGVSALLIFSLSSCYSADQCTSSGWNVFSHSLLLAIASASSGGLLGFLFGIPRTLARATSNNKDKGQPPTIDTAAGKAAITDVRRQTVNTNLEEISDWLTKILVGAGLVQLQNIPTILHKGGIQFQKSLGNSELAVLGAIINFSVWGFFAGYLLTRLFLAGAFKLADEGYLADLNTQDVKTAVKVGEVLRETKQYTKARIEYEKALEKVNESTPKEAKRKLYEGIVFNSLYDNYEDAIEYALRYLTEEPRNPSPLIEAYLGFAYGQQYRAKKTQRDSMDLQGPKEQVQALEAEMKQIRQKALDAIRKALKLEPSLRPLIRMVWDKNDPAKSPGSEDDDLEVFYGDPDFTSLLGPS
ncbi:MAG: hypothetical protein P0111_18235 [Nitrospira sp.]|nr:hypothetical protein [Nitrospira sp.]